MLFRVSGRRWVLAVFCVVAFCALPAHPCSIPVFRYALARWPADDYTVTVLHRGPLTGAQQRVIQWLEKCRAGEGARANFVLEIVDLAKRTDQSASKEWRAAATGELPRIVVQYPERTKSNLAAWSGPLTAETARVLMDSPVRKEIARRIAGGDAAVWVLLESGIKEQDDAVANLLQTELDNRATLDDLSFSLLRLARDDAAEAIVVQMFLHTERDLKGFTEPMAFPIFGRGRILYALVGKGISKENIATASGFIGGPCSCEVKTQSPGTDLLLSMDWDSLLDGKLLEDLDLPSLGDLPEEPTATATVSSPVVSESAAPLKPAPPALLRNILLATVAAVAILAAFAVTSRSRKKRGSS